MAFARSVNFRHYPGRRHMAASLRAFVDLAQEIVFRNRAKAP